MRKVAAAVLLLGLLAPVCAYPQAKNGKAGVYEQLNLFGEAFERIRQDSVQPVTDSQLVDTAITGMLTSLDPHAAYLSEAAYKALQAPVSDSSATIGLVVTIDNGQLKVVSPRDGSPAAQAGLKPNDMIFSIDKEPTFDMTLSDVEQKLRGPAGSEVALSLRHSTGDLAELKVKRESQKLQTVSSHVEGSNIGYIRIAGFDDTTQAALTGALRDLRQKLGGQLTGLIVDLRNNPGGTFDVGVAVADDFIDKGDIVIVKGRKADSVKHIAATPGDLASGLPIVALVNGGTANEAELVAGALQDNRRAVLLGSKTFGESSIESFIPVHGNGAIRLTTARFQTPSGHAIEGKGIAPDLNVVPVKIEKLAQGDRRREADLRGALKNTDPVGPNATKNPAPNTPPGATPTPPPAEAPSVATGDMGTQNDEQLSQAIDVLRGLSVVSGRTAQAR